MAELLLAAAILAVGLLGLAALQAATTGGAAAAAARQTAACLAEGSLEGCQAEGRRAFLERCRQEPAGAAGDAPWPGPRVECYDREGRPAGADPAFFTVTVTRTAPDGGAGPAWRVRARVAWAQAKPAAPGRLSRSRLVLF